MQRFLNWLDKLAVTNEENKTAQWLDRIAFFFLILMALSAPHSIAATQTAWLIGNFAWLIRLFIKPRPKLLKTPLNLALWIFFAWSVVTCFFSYAPDISFEKLRGVALFLIFFYVANNLRSFRAVKFIVSALIFSAMVVVLWTPLERIIGRGVEVYGVAAESPLTKTIYVENNNEPIVIKDGDALLEVNKKKIKSPEQLVEEIEKNETARLKFYRPDYYLIVQIKRSDLLEGATANEKLGITAWKKSRNWRSMGFYGHWTTFSEVLQLIASLVFGLLIASFSDRKEDFEKRKFSVFGKFTFSPLLLFCFAAMCLALLLNVTRASQLGLIASMFSIVFLVNRKMILVLAVIFLPVALGGLLFIQQSRNVGYFDRNDDSIKYRESVYQEGANLWTQNARHFLVGVGMDSIKRYAKDWRLFEDGKLPLGHFHSTLLQLAVERGLPALLLWFWIVWLYAREMKSRISDSGFQIKENQSEIREIKSGIRNLKSGILLGVFGGLVGFFTSGIVHYNLGDAEVAMIFFLLMGIGVSLKGMKDEG
ncbi:MAG: O-antigen ligase family protein [Pyrinomonadaceae bacterium]|nr:O-antigen ligase family protein [Pyrinomonadaceae bacterium]